MLFTIFINDLDEGIKFKIIKFADDTKIYTEIRNDLQPVQIQNDIDQLVKWSSDWQMLLNMTKCSVLHLGYNNQQKVYCMEGTQIKTTKKERDLGVFIQSDLKPSKQCVKALRRPIECWDLLRGTLKTSRKK